MIEIYWSNADGDEAAYVIQLKECAEGQRGWKANQAAMFQATKITEVLKQDGYKLHFRSKQCKSQD